MQYLMPVVIAVVYVLLMSLIREPERRRFNAIMVAGAGAAYLGGGGLGGWEFAFTALATYVAYRGLDSWAFIGIGWLLHTTWDVVHHMQGAPLIPFLGDSSLGCAICDPVIAAWCLTGGRTPRDWRPPSTSFASTWRPARRLIALVAGRRGVMLEERMPSGGGGGGRARAGRRRGWRR